MFGTKGEIVNHLVSECDKLAQQEWKRHDELVRYIYKKMPEKCEIVKVAKQYETIQHKHYL